jgi:hypothetical protein
MARPFLIAAAAIAALVLSSTAFAQQSQFGTPDEAKAMLLRGDSWIASSIFFATM